ncbi:TRAP transporter TatT component family protein [Pseudomarimonas arenosa]|uniref:TRAP transporter TatT component family protein n=1 Tax=Pseudomarimonas arenosa TaxID=2774145 RepID=A0AAW3ZGZ6_9GAMM|nr:TRAP transporter TatT component family protein [Pseudomarimonas arenosa]MBD8525301.1 hypothetical protein [Pseudomarimonas arenosa]
MFSGVGNGLAAGIRSHDDPKTVAEALPAYLLLLDGLLIDRPESKPLLSAAAELNATYAVSFIDEPERARRLSRRALDYARRYICLQDEALCQALDGPVDVFQAQLQSCDAQSADMLFVLGNAWATYIQANSQDWGAIAALPKVESLIGCVIEQQPLRGQGMPWVVMGVLNSLRPAAVGGQPEQAKAAFERAVEVSSGRNLMAKAMFAQHYARAQFDRELHDRLVEEVLSADATAPELTLANVLAKQRAKHLMETADDYF